MINYSESFIDFLRRSECKVARLLYLAHCAEGDNNYPKAYKLFVSNKQIDYVTFRNDGTISYLPAGKKHQVNDDGTWKREGRQNGKPGKVIAKLFTPNALKVLHVKEFESFTNQYKAEYNDSNFTFSLRSNKQIPRVYEMDLAEGEGTLNGSCMNGESGYLGIYKACGQLSILTLTDTEDKLCGRALVWKISEELTIMDRIYVVKDWMYDMFLNHARSKSWYHKKHYKTYDNKQIFMAPDGEEKIMRLKIDTETEFDEYPYIDTFSYGDYGSLNNWGGGCYTYNNTDGGRGGDEEEEDEHEHDSWDDIDECYIDDDDARYIDNGEKRGLTTHYNNTVEVGRYTYWRRDPDIIELDGEWYHCDDVVFCENDDGEDHLREECVEVDDNWYQKDSEHIVEIDGEYHLKEDCVEINDTWYCKDSDEVCEIDGEYYLKDSDEVVEVDGEYTLRQLTLPLNIEA